jgi:hypothetical protein
VRTRLRITPLRISRRPAALAAALALAAGLSACGHKEAHPTTADTEGVYVDAGPLSYQVQISRQLNPFATEDKTYLTGVDSPALKQNEMWFAVFMWAKNETHQNETTTNSFDIVDTQGNKYYPVAINPAINPFAWTAQTLRPNGIQPAPDSIASFGPTQGGELLFKLNTSVYSNRPLTLEINAPGQQDKPSLVSLDL